MNDNSYPPSNDLTPFLIDFHTHILPGIDDGSQSLEESLRMIEISAAQGVGCIALTPHFYATRENPERFIEKREKAFGLLKASLPSGSPILLPGAEVEYFEGISEVQELDRFRIGNSCGLLVEMPFCHWTNRMIRDIIDLNNRKGYSVILAHIERYLKFQKIDAIYHLVENGILIQSNANSFLSRLKAGKLLRMIDDGVIHLLGSDCHNLTTRPPNLKEAYGIVAKKLGGDVVERMTGLGRHLVRKDLML